MIRKMMIVFAMMSLFAMSAIAQDGTGGADSANGMKYIAAAITVGLSFLGIGLAQGRAAAAALEGITRNPSSQKAVFTPMLIALAFMEALGLFAFALAFLIQGA